MLKAGTHIKSITKLHEMHGSERIVYKSKGGTIIIDGGGITLKGNVTIKGNVAISGGSGGGAQAANLRVNEGIPYITKRVLSTKWTYGEYEKPLAKVSKHYVDMNLHVNTFGYTEGESVKLDLTMPDGKKKNYTVNIDKHGVGKIMNIFKDEEIVLEENNG